MKLNQTAHLILGMLSFGFELSGYELRQWSERSVAAFYKPPAQSQIYRELASLEALELVTSTSVAGTEAPDKTVFSLTDAGRLVLEEWLSSGVASGVVLKHPLALQTSFAAGVDPAPLVEQIDAHIESTMAMLHDLEDLIIGLEDDPGSVLARTSLEWAIDMRRADVAGAERARAVLLS